MPLPVCYLNGEYSAARGRAGVAARSRVPVRRCGLRSRAGLRGRPFRLREHLDRLTRSLSGIRMRSAPRRMPNGTRSAASSSRATAAAINISISRSRAARNSAAITPGRRGSSRRCSPMTNRLEPPVARICSRRASPRSRRRTSRWARRDIKSTALLANMLLKKLAADAGAFETILLEHGELTEGSSTTVHVVKRRRDPHAAQRPSHSSGHDPRRGQRARGALGIPSASGRVTEAELRAADEIWLAFSTRGSCR